MPKSLLGRCVYLFIGCAACTTLIMNGLSAWAYFQNLKEESKSEEESDDEMAYEDDI